MRNKQTEMFDQTNITFSHAHTHTSALFSISSIAANRGRVALSRPPSAPPHPPQVDSLSQTWLPLGGCPASTQSSRAGYKWKKKKKKAEQEQTQRDRNSVRSHRNSVECKAKASRGKKAKTQIVFSRPQIRGHYHANANKTTPNVSTSDSDTVCISRT